MTDYHKLYCIYQSCVGRYTASPPSHHMDSSYITLLDGNYISYSYVYISYSYVYISCCIVNMSISWH
jgi:hypothetical protein